MSRSRCGNRPYTVAIFSLGFAVGTPLFFLSAPLTAQAECTEVTYAKVTPPAYPPQSVARREDGTTMVKVAMDDKGVPLNVIVEKSSGSEALDEAAVAAVKEWRFNPSLCNRVAVEGEVIVPVAFDLGSLPVESIEVALADPPDQAGVPVLSAIGRQVAPDLMPVEADNAEELLRILRGSTHATMAARHEIDKNSYIADFLDSNARVTWEAFDARGNVQGSADANLSIVRTRFKVKGNTLWELYAQSCDGSAPWCSWALSMYHLRRKDDLPPLLRPVVE